MRAFHISWGVFFFCFFAWFGVAPPLMPVIREELMLGEVQVGNIVIPSVAATIVARPLIGRLCDWIGPRRVYSGLLVGLPVSATMNTMFYVNPIIRACLGHPYPEGRQIRGRLDEPLEVTLFPWCTRPE